MPNAHDYRAAARRLRHLAAVLTHEIVVVRAVSDPTRFVGGPVQSSLADALDVAGTSVHRAATELDRLASICDRRAEVCAAYAADLDRHHRLRAVPGAIPGATPAAPDRPAWWVTP